MQCLNSAKKTYHQLEAKINFAKFFQKKDEGYEEMSGLIFLAYRAVTQKPLDFFLNDQKFNEVNEKFGAEFDTDDDVYHWSDYRGLYYLEGHR